MIKFDFIVTKYSLSYLRLTRSTVMKNIAFNKKKDAYIFLPNFWYKPILTRYISSQVSEKSVEQKSKEYKGQ